MRVPTPTRAVLATMAVAGVTLAVGACDDSMAPRSAAAVPAPSFDQGGTQGHFNTKFEFTGLTLGTYTDATIRAGSKSSNNGQDTNCGYFTADDAYLGFFDSQAFASPDADAVRDFCVNHFPDRTT